MIQNFDRSSLDEIARFYHERGIGERVGFGARPAILVVDLINGFTNPAFAPGLDLDKVVQFTRDLLDIARATRVPVLFTTIVYREPGCTDGGLFVAKMPALRVLHEDSEAIQLDKRLERLPEEPLLEKQFVSAFFGTSLKERLSIHGVDTLIIAGATTSGCVRATVVDGLQHGFRMLVVEECVGDRAGLPHAAALLDMDSKYADIIYLDETIAYLQGLRTGRPSTDEFETSAGGD